MVEVVVVASSSSNTFLFEFQVVSDFIKCGPYVKVCAFVITKRVPLGTFTKKVLGQEK